MKLSDLTPLQLKRINAHVIFQEWERVFNSITLDDPIILYYQKRMPYDLIQRLKARPEQFENLKFAISFARLATYEDGLLEKKIQKDPEFVGKFFKKKRWKLKKNKSAKLNLNLIAFCT